jgi:hypothetical protein
MRSQLATYPLAVGPWTLKEMHFHAPKILNCISMKATYPWSEGLITHEESHFQVAKMSNSGWYEASCPGVEDLTTRQESIFREVAQRESCILQTRASSPLKNLIFRQPKGRTDALWMLDTFLSMVSWHSSNRILKTSKFYNVFHWKPWTIELRVSQLDMTCIIRAS